MRATYLAALVAAALVAGTASAGAGPTAQEEDDKLVLTNGDITVEFVGKEAVLKVFPTANAAAAWKLRFDRVVEFQDADADGLADLGEVRAFLDLADAESWRVETTTDADSAEVRIGLEAPLTLQTPAGIGVPVPADRLTGNVTLVFTVFAAPATVDSENASITVELTEVRMDFRVESWSWIDASGDSLALFADVPSDLSLGALGATVVEADSTIGGIDWLPTAEAETDGETETVDVETEIVSDDGAARLQHAFAASGFDTLEHHSSLGVVATLPEEVVPEGVIAGKVRDVPAAGVLLAAAAAAGTAFVMARKR